MAGESPMTTKPISIESTGGKPGRDTNKPNGSRLKRSVTQKYFRGARRIPASRATIRSVISAEVLSFQRVVSYFPKITVLGKCEAAAI